MKEFPTCRFLTTAFSQSDEDSAPSDLRQQYNEFLDVAQDFLLNEDFFSVYDTLDSPLPSGISSGYALRHPLARGPAKHRMQLLTHRVNWLFSSSNVIQASLAAAGSQKQPVAYATSCIPFCGGGGIEEDPRNFRVKLLKIKYFTLGIWVQFFEGIRFAYSAMSIPSRHFIDI